MSAMDHHPFVRWLNAQQWDETPSGDLARDVIADVKAGCLTELSDPASLRAHMLAEHPSAYAAARALDLAELEWVDGMSCQPTDPVPVDPEDYSITDHGAAYLPLDDGWVASEAVEPDGSRSYWLLDPDTDDDVSYPMPAHELEGPLPADVFARLWEWHL